jgi:hypothetical protein
MAVVRKARKAGAQYVGREPSQWTLKTLRLTDLIFAKR